MVDIRRHQNKVTLAQINDLHAITDILNQAIAWGNANAYFEPLNAEDRINWFKENMHGKYAVYVYRHENKILGYLNIGPYRKGRGAFRNTAEVSYYVDFEHHRLGIASALMESAFEHCRKNGIKNLLAFLYDHNKTSIQFLEKFNFERWGLFPGTAEVGVKLFDHVVYGKKIN